MLCGVQLIGVGLLEATGQPAVGGHQQPPRERRQVGCEGDGDRVLGQPAQLHLDLGLVGVTDGRVGGDALGGLTERGGFARGAAGAGDARLAVDHEVWVDNARLHEWSEREDGGGGIAAGVGNGGGLGDRITVQLGEPVAPRLAQVAGEVDDQRAGVGQLLSDGARSAVRQGEQGHIAALEHRGLAPGRGHPQRGMGGDQPVELTARIARGAGDAGGENGRR